MQNNIVEIDPYIVKEFIQQRFIIILQKVSGYQLLFDNLNMRKVGIDFDSRKIIRQTNTGVEAFFDWVSEVYSITEDVEEAIKLSQELLKRDNLPEEIIVFAERITSIKDNPEFNELFSHFYEALEAINKNDEAIRIYNEVKASREAEIKIISIK